MFTFFYRPDFRLSDEQFFSILRNKAGRVVKRAETTYVQQGDCLYQLPRDYEFYFYGTFLYDHGEGDKLVDIRKHGPLEFCWQATLTKILSRNIGTLYLIHCRELYKIGITTDFSQRYRRYVTECPFAKDVVFQVRVPGFQQIEQMAKSFFAPKQYRGEWFRLTSGDVRLLRGIVYEELIVSECFCEDLPSLPN